MYMEYTFPSIGIKKYVTDKDEYRFISNTKRKYFVVKDERAWTGKLDVYGGFIFFTDSCPKEQIGLLMWQGYWPLVRFPNGKPEVYEYRSGYLIPGRIDKDTFVPDLGGKIMDFEKYRYSPQGRAIYNLPGYFTPREPKTPQRQGPPAGRPQ
jgi:hypothetical protein